MTLEAIRAKIVRNAIGDAGIKESPAGSNMVKYNDWYYQYPHYYYSNSKPFAWCATFVSYVYHWSGKSLPRIDDATGFRDVRSGYNFFRKYGMITDDPQPGDIVIYDWDNDRLGDHTGIFVKWIDQEAGIFEAVEGNTSPDEEGSQSNGGMVCVKKRYASTVQAFVNYLDNAE